MARINLARLRRAIRGALGPPAISVLEWLVARRSWEETGELGRKLGEFGFRHLRRHRARATSNVRHAFGDELSEERVEEIVSGSFQHLTTLFLEMLRMPTMSREELLDVVEISGAEHLQAALDAGKGAITFSGHLGSWEVGMVRGIYEGWPMLPLSRAPRSARLARRITGVREKLGFQVIPVGEGIRGIIRALRSNHIVPIMPDRFAWGKGLTVPFFGHETHVWHTPALIAQRAGCPIIPTHAIRRPDGGYMLEIDPPVELQDTGDRDRDVWVNTARGMAALEAKIRRTPEQYMWHYLLWRPGHEFPLPYPITDLNL